MSCRTRSPCTSGAAPCKGRPRFQLDSASKHTLVSAATRGLHGSGDDIEPQRNQDNRPDDPPPPEPEELQIEQTDIGHEEEQANEYEDSASQQLAASQPGCRGRTGCGGRFLRRLHIRDRLASRSHWYRGPADQIDDDAEAMRNRYEKCRDAHKDRVD